MTKKQYINDIINTPSSFAIKNICSSFSFLIFTFVSCISFSNSSHEPTNPQSDNSNLQSDTFKATQPILLNSCDAQLLLPAPQTTKASIDNAINELIIAGFRDPKLRIGKMGFLGIRPYVTPEILEMAGKIGILRWEQKIFVVKDANEIVRHQDPKRPDRTLYFVSPENSATSSNDLSSRPILYYFDGKSVISLTQSETWELLKPEAMYFHKPQESSQLPYYSIEGWVMPAERYIISQKQVQESQKTYGKIKDFALKAIASHYQIVFNNNADLATDLSRTHDRNYISKSKFSIAVGMDLFRFKKLFDAGKAFTVEVYSQHTKTEAEYGKGGMVAGVTGHIQGSVFAIDSIFYPPVENGLSYAQAAMLALLDRLFEAGVEFVDVTKISHLAQEFRALKLSHEEFMELVALQMGKQLVNKEIMVDWSTSYGRKASDSASPERNDP